MVTLNDHRHYMLWISSPVVLANNVDVVWYRLYLIMEKYISRNCYETAPPQKPSRQYRTKRITLMAIAMAIIFLIDTATNYEVAVSVFYTVVILTVARVLNNHALVVLTGTCIGISLLSFVMTTHGNYRAGLINMLISIVSILLTGYLVCKMQSVRAAAYEAQARLLRIHV